MTQAGDAGVARSVGNLVADQVSRGWKVDVACPAEGSLAKEVPSLRATHFPWNATRSPGRALVRETATLARIVRVAQPDLVHLHSAKAGVAGRLALRGSLPTIFQPRAWSFHAGGPATRRASRGWEQAAARWTTMIVCVSETERVEGERAGITANWHVIPNGVDIGALTWASEADRLEARGRLQLSADPLVVCIGRLSRQKGQDVLLAGWRRVAERIPAAKLVLIGNLFDADEMLRAAVAREEPHGVRFVGQRSDVPDWLAAADVVAIPSRWEGMAYAMLEAMARGRSVVSTDVAGARECLGGVAGEVVPVEDPDSLAAAIADRLADPAKAAAEGNAGRRRVEASYDVRRTVAAMAALYHDVFAGVRRDQEVESARDGSG